MNYRSKYQSFRILQTKQIKKRIYSPAMANGLQTVCKVFLMENWKLLGLFSIIINLVFSFWIINLILEKWLFCRKLEKWNKLGQLFFTLPNWNLLGKSSTGVWFRLLQIANFSCKINVFYKNICFLVYTNWMFLKHNSSVVGSYKEKSERADFETLSKK